MLYTSLHYLCNILCHHATLLDYECGFHFLSWKRFRRGTFPLQTILKKVGLEEQSDHSWPSAVVTPYGLAAPALTGESFCW